MSDTNKGYCVYKHTNIFNGKVYVGITSNDPKIRWNNGNGYKRQSYFWNAIQKHGWNNFRHEILFENLSEEEACKKEIDLISFYHSNDKEYGYNISFGGFSGQSGLQRTDKQKDKFREAQRKSRNKSFSEWRICQFDIDGSLLNIYDYLSVASEQTGILSQTIRQACEKGYGHSKGFIWSYYGVCKNYIKIISKLQYGDKILQLDKDGCVVKTYLCEQSIKIVSPEFSSLKKIRQCLNKEIEYAYEYTWVYENDPCVFYYRNKNESEEQKI